MSQGLLAQPAGPTRRSEDPGRHLKMPYRHYASSCRCWGALRTASLVRCSSRGRGKMSRSPPVNLRSGPSRRRYRIKLSRDQVTKSSCCRGNHVHYAKREIWHTSRAVRPAWTGPATCAPPFTVLNPTCRCHKTPRQLLGSHPPLLFNCCVTCLLPSLSHSPRRLSPRCRISGTSLGPRAGLHRLAQRLSP